MPNINETEKMARKLLPIIYVLDTSGSMSGDRIASVNEAMHETVDVLRDVSRNNPSAELKIGVLQFDSGAQWVTRNGLVYLEDYFWNDLVAGGMTDFGSALEELDAKLSRSGFLDSDVGYKVPVIIFMSDGYPTDDWQSALEHANASNKWFRVATKISIAVGDSADKNVLACIAGRNGQPNNEAVISVNDMESLKKLIRVVSVTASMIGSKSRTATDSQNEVLREVKREMSAEGGKIDPEELLPTFNEKEDAFYGASGDPWSDDGWD